MKFQVVYQKQPYWFRGTATEWQALPYESKTIIWSQKPATQEPEQPVRSGQKTFEQRIADLERRVGILERDDQG
jgi:hypothetical protein